MRGSSKDYYEELEVSTHATSDEIRTSYKKLALKFHPDRNPGSVERCQEKFKKISRAYKVLSDPSQRSLYDANPESFHGTNVDASARPFGFHNFPANGFHFSAFDSHFGHHTGFPTEMFFGSGGFNDLDLFDLLFSHGGSRPRRAQGASKTRSTASKVDLLRQILVCVTFLVFSSGWGTYIIYANLYLFMFIVCVIVLAAYRKHAP